MAAFGLTAGSGLPLLTRITFSTCRAHYPGGSIPGTSRSFARLPARAFPSIALAFPEPITGRHPRRAFRGLLKLHSRYGPLICSPNYVGLVGRLRRRPFRDDAASQLLRHTDILLWWAFHPPVFGAVTAHIGFVWQN